MSKKTHKKKREKEKTRRATSMSSCLAQDFLPVKEKKREKKRRIVKLDEVLAVVARAVNEMLLMMMGECPSVSTGLINAAANANANKTKTTFI